MNQLICTSYRNIFRRHWHCVWMICVYCNSRWSLHNIYIGKQRDLLRIVNPNEELQSTRFRVIWITFFLSTIGVVEVGVVASVFSSSVFVSWSVSSRLISFDWVVSSKFDRSRISKSVVNICCLPSESLFSSCRTINCIEIKTAHYIIDLWISVLYSWDKVNEPERSCGAMKNLCFRNIRNKTRLINSATPQIRMIQISNTVQTPFYNLPVQAFVPPFGPVSPHPHRLMTLTSSVQAFPNALRHFLRPMLRLLEAYIHSMKHIKSIYRTWYNYKPVFAYSFQIGREWCNYRMTDLLNVFLSCSLYNFILEMYLRLIPAMDRTHPPQTLLHHCHRSPILLISSPIMNQKYIQEKDLWTQCNHHSVPSLNHKNKTSTVICLLP